MCPPELPLSSYSGSLLAVRTEHILHRALPDAARFSSATVLRLDRGAGPVMAAEARRADDRSEAEPCRRTILGVLAELR